MNVGYMLIPVVLFVGGILVSTGPLQARNDADRGNREIGERSPLSNRALRFPGRRTAASVGVPEYRPWAGGTRTISKSMSKAFLRPMAPYHRSLVKFLVVSALSLFIGTMHGMLQVMPPIRAWLDSIGSPYGGPGHMIDPLAHAHINLVGGVVMLVMGVTYYLLPIL